MFIPVEISTSELARSLDCQNREDLTKLILEIDIAVAETEFTEGLIVELTQSLLQDISDSGQRSLVRTKLRELMETIKTALD